MKQRFVYYTCLVFITLLTISNATNSQSSVANENSKPVKAKNQSKDDMVLERIRTYIYQFADKISKQSDLKLKRKINGQLPDTYPKTMIENAKKKRYNFKYWNKLLKFPTDIHRICVYPEYIFKLNIMKWCETKYGAKSKKRLTACKNTFCTVCCDHIRQILKNQAEKQILGEMLFLNNNPGYAKILKVLTDNDIKKCRRTCSTTFPVDFPVVLPPPPRDPSLGTKPESAAKSCTDIQKWGNKNAKSGTYWIELGFRGKNKVFCDMETDGGGWTLFFNYLHYPGQEVNLDSSKIPSDLKQNSHINLKDVGIGEKNVSELRFFCTERSNKKYFWHFRSKSQELINVALSGDQRHLNQNSIKSGYHDLPFPGNGITWTRIIDKDRLRSLDKAGSSRDGGFWGTPFGSDKRQKYWTVKGNVIKGGRFECGSAHKDPLRNPMDSLVMTHHTVWFKGPPPSEKEARNRYTARNAKLK